MFTRDELVSKSVDELQQLGKNLGIEPIGNPAYESTWIAALLSAEVRGMEDCENGRGLKRFPSATVVLDIEKALDVIGQPTPAQRVLIRAALQGIWMKRIDYRSVQQRLFEMWQARVCLLEALKALK
ncbi:hypothetical protein [Calothrix sp. PCC 7507]|uniref:hypothetical protein n=1 Tax=Calothrix sp. PCC 7507 TaxID=99598 RepID=UPI00029F37BF|nr:hypothetical protein [Calothrix sp. PCC 7507]AFY34499.1 hypothetical protein Cal7507_4118 [Calothrix sp. PCC 7507]